jgi:hypothetical protein
VADHLTARSLAKPIIFLILIGLVIVVLNCPWYLIEKTSLVHRIADPVLMLVGLIGSVFQIRLFRAVGWIAILWFAPVVLYSTPDMEHATPMLKGLPIFWRLGATLLLCVMLVLVFRLLSPRHRASADKLD